VDRGLAHLRDGLRDWSATGSVTYQTYYLGLLAEVLGIQGQFDEARRVLDEAIALAGQTGEGLVEAELHRLQGEMILRETNEPEGTTFQQAAEQFQRALEIARRQETKSLELRTAMSLARLSRRTGRLRRHADSSPTHTTGSPRGFRLPTLWKRNNCLEA
jgi:predicted ATPase